MRKSLIVLPLSLVFLASASACSDDAIGEDLDTLTDTDDEVGDTETDTAETETSSTDTDTGETDTGETDTGETDTGETDTGETDTGETDTGQVEGEAGLRVLHAGLDAGDVDVYLDGADDPLVATLPFESGVAYITVEAGSHTIVVTPAGGAIEDAMLTTDIELQMDSDYSFALYDYLANFSGLLLEDSYDGPAEGNTLFQISHVAPDVDQVDLYMLSEEPIQALVSDLDFGAAQVVEAAAGALPVGIDVDDDQVPDLTYTLPDFGADVLVDLYVVNQADEAVVFLLAQLSDGSVVRIDSDVCGDGVAQYLELCDGEDFKELTCADMGKASGVLTCNAACGVEIDACTDYYEFCSEEVLDIPDNDQDGVTQDIVIADEIGTVGDIDVYLDVSHTWLNDLNFDLTKDGGTNVLIVDGFLDQDNSSCGGDDMIAVLDDEAATSIVNACDTDIDPPAINGTFAPEGALADFDGEAGTGTWTLHVYDQFNQDTGDVNQWCVRITPE
ncbi:DUF4397 domain-containing protein [Pseudenhygromyxa sp. WMMC2535]|uniref:DUF4397 domain-containing protein n=1 Tax=Pseudenhygromyxa sp. WMMC2535 TaxID=2712867 RepID=UPI001555F061|nr:DUF4397 domain-containing protein [Pseudenhygromyxa sp. WMMC2535]NVB42472.1 DUF4397 domain-containing protein [Pseudenhygromyxa sp. WMMC2535]